MVTQGAWAGSRHRLADPKIKHPVHLWMDSERKTLQAPMACKAGAGANG